VKDPATRTAKTTKPAAKQVKERSSASSAKAKPLASTAAKSLNKAAAKPAAKTVAKSPPVKLAAPLAPKASVKKPAPASKPLPAKKPVPVKAAAKAAAVPVSKSAPKPAVKSAPKAAAKAAVLVPQGKPVSAPAPAKRAAAAKSAPIVVEPTPRPLGKRAAKKVMMEQMTQAAVVPTHAPDAAKATFSTMNERLMSPPVPSSIQKDPKRANNWKSLSVEQLTDQDVQAMPDTEYMNEVQLAFFRRKLSLLKADMLANAVDTTEHLREDTVVVPDPADRATIEEEHALELRTRDRERKLLKKIEQAIVRIDAGDYGYCEETGEAIGVGRLMARPTASLSLEAQQRRELKQKMFGD
jgi:DnaK suppressor protein